MAEIEFDGVSKVFDDGTVGLEELSLEVADGEFIVLVGPSGSGKSTALRILAGLEEETTGTVRIGDRVVNDLEPKDRDVAMVFQTYALYPHMSVAANLGFGLRQRGEEARRIEARVGETAARLGISELLDRAPRQLSGGQRQRVALGRAIIREPQAFLMDEPLSNLDAMLRVEMRAYISRLQDELRTTTVYVTHDQVEAMTMGDRVAVMRNGRLEQIDVPQALYERPANAFVAGFIGSPSMNLLRARLERHADGMSAVLGTQRIAIPAAVLEGHRTLPAFDDREVVLGIRPEAMTGGEEDVNGTIDGVVLLVESLGSDALAHVEIDAVALPPEAIAGADRGADAAPEPEETIGTRRARVTARLPIHEAPRSGGRLSLHVDPNRLHFFDPADGRALD